MTGRAPPAKLRFAPRVRQSRRVKYLPTFAEVRLMENNVDVSLTVNGKPRTFRTPGERTLLEVLREELQLTGTKYGCGEGACGACTVLVDGKRTFSCSTSVSSVVGKKITTIEGLADGEKLHPVQQAFAAEGAFQC